VRRDAAVLIILVSLAVTYSGIPAISAVVAHDTRQAWPIVTSPELNVTGADIANHSIPSGYGTSPTLINVKVEISDTLLPGPKGEMAAGPRTIGFSAEPLSLVILGVVIIAGAAGVWYLVKRKPDEVEEDGDEESGE
jgi:hypothetical protein